MIPSIRTACRYDYPNGRLHDRDLRRWIVGFGADVRVAAPTELMQQISTLVQEVGLYIQLKTLRKSSIFQSKMIGQRKKCGCRSYIVKCLQFNLALIFCEESDLIFV